jgi:hypothetical protein
MSVGFKEYNEDEERARLRKLSDAELIREGRALGVCAILPEISGNRRAMFG